MTGGSRGNARNSGKIFKIGVADRPPILGRVKNPQRSGGIRRGYPIGRGSWGGGVTRFPQPRSTAICQLSAQDMNKIKINTNGRNAIVAM